MNKFFGSRCQSSLEQVFWQSSPAGVSPGLLALDLGCAIPGASVPSTSLRWRDGASCQCSGFHGPMRCGSSATRRYRSAAPPWRKKTTWVGCLRIGSSEVQGEEPWGDARRRRLPKTLATAALATTAKKLVNGCSGDDCQKTCQRLLWRRLPKNL